MFQGGFCSTEYWTPLFKLLSSMTDPVPIVPFAIGGPVEGPSHFVFISGPILVSLHSSLKRNNNCHLKFFRVVYHYLVKLSVRLFALNEITLLVD